MSNIVGSASKRLSVTLRCLHAQPKISINAMRGKGQTCLLKRILSFPFFFPYILNKWSVKKHNIRKIFYIKIWPYPEREQYCPASIDIEWCCRKEMFSFLMLVFNCIKHLTVKVIVKVAQNLSSSMVCIMWW